MSYRDNVDLAATALVRGEDANWELARLTFENTRDRATAGEQIGRVLMDEWCADVRAASGRRFGVTTGYQYKAVWRRFGYVEIQDRPSWTDAMLSIHNAPREDKPESDTVRPEIEYKSALPPALAAEAKRAIFAELAADPAVLEEAAEIGSPVSRAISGLEYRAERVREERRERMVAADPVMRRHEQDSAIADLMSLCDRYARDSERVAKEIADLLRRGGPITEDRLFWVRQAADRLRAVLDVLDGYATAGKSDLDTFLGDVLSGGGRGQSHGQ